jgi:hypothetical protein
MCFGEKKKMPSCVQDPSPPKVVEFKAHRHTVTPSHGARSTSHVRNMSCLRP